MRLVEGGIMARRGKRGKSNERRVAGRQRDANSRPSAIGVQRQVRALDPDIHEASVELRGPPANRSTQVTTPTTANGKLKDNKGI